MRLPTNWFLGGLAIAVGSSLLWPSPGAHGGALHPEILNKIGIALIFLISGVSLPFRALADGMLHWRLHALAQACVFLVFPLLGLALFAATAGWLIPELRLGIFFLCALPSTVSSAVAMTAAARGNVPAAILNAVLSSLLGVVLTPVWLSLLMQANGQAMPLGPVILDLIVWLVLPLIVGQAVRPWLGAWADRHKARLSVVDRLTILLLVYTSFCDATAAGIWRQHGLSALLAAIVLSMLAFAVVMWVADRLSVAMGFTLEDRIAIMFIGSKKSLATGVPMAQIMFGGTSSLGMVLLPIMVYHPMQLVICGVLARRWAGRDTPPA